VALLTCLDTICSSSARFDKGCFGVFGCELKEREEDKQGWDIVEDEWKE
jgi:hypothetical protein